MPIPCTLGLTHRLCLLYSNSSQTSQRGKETMRRAKKSSKPGIKSSGQPWQLQTAKAQFSELFRRARTEGPQVVTRQGKEQVVVLPAEQFAQLTKRVRQPKSLVKFFAESPLARATVDLSRDLDSGREIKL
jgi:antitoxin Phd